MDFYDANRSFYASLLAGPGKGRSGADRGRFSGADGIRLLDAHTPPSLEEGARILSDFHRRLYKNRTGYSPTRIGWGWILCPTLKSAAAADAFVRDRKVNPFVALAETDFAVRLSANRYRSVVFEVQDTVQCPAALTLSAYCRENMPGAERILEAPAHIAGEMEPFFDRTTEKSSHFGPAAFPVSGETIQPRFDESEPFDEAAKVLVWRSDTELVPDLSKRLTAAAGQGLWNHLDITGAVPVALSAEHAAIHSWCSWAPAPYLPAGAARLWPDRVDRYRGVRPIAGTPFWRVVRDPAVLALWLAEMTTAELSRWRLDDATGEAFRLGDDLRYRFVPPDALAAEEMDEVCQMVIAGGSVGARWVRRNLQQAYLIGVVTDRGVVVANSSLKHPRREYIEKVSRAAGVDLTGFLERGYTSVRPEYRGLGIGTRLLEGLTRRAADCRIFSIIGEDNLATQKIAIRNRTKKVLTFYSQALQKPVGLWMPEATADEVMQNRKES